MKRDALMYLEMRHLFIHAKGFVDDQYANTYGSSFYPELKVSDELPRKFETFNEALEKITGLVKHIDKELTSKGFIQVRKIKDSK